MAYQHRVETHRAPKPRQWVRPKDAWEGRTFTTWDGYTFETVALPETRWDGRGSNLTQQESFERGRKA